MDVLDVKGDRNGNLTPMENERESEGNGNETPKKKTETEWETKQKLDGDGHGMAMRHGKWETLASIMGNMERTFGHAFSSLPRAFLAYRQLRF